MPLSIVFLRPQKLVSTRTLLLKHYYRRQGLSVTLSGHFGPPKPEGPSADSFLVTHHCEPPQSRHRVLLYLSHLRFLGIARYRAIPPFSRGIAKLC